MIAKKHFHRIKNIYTSNSANPIGDRVEISYGRAVLEGTIASAQSEAVINRMAHHRLLSDVSSLAAATLEKEHFVTAEKFFVNVENPQYEGSVEAAAEVVMVDPPEFIVEGVLRSSDGELIAESSGVFRPTDATLPSDEIDDSDVDISSTIRPARVMAMHATPFGILFLN